MKTNAFAWLLLTLCLCAMPISTAVAAEDTAGAPRANTMPSANDIMNVVDKATTDPLSEQPSEWAAPVKLVVVFTLLALLPSIMAMTTSFTRIVIVLGFIRRALSTQNIPPNTAIMGLALFLTLYTMAPTFYRINEEAVQPYLNEEIEFQQVT
ncbi:MAG: flagellar type III secretion system pore protein FliP, partial [Planctomycetota bacterium]